MLIKYRNWRSRSRGRGGGRHVDGLHRPHPIVGTLRLLYLGMRMTPRKTASVGFWLTIAIVPLFAQHALHVEATIGFGGLFRAGSWTPVSVTVTNLGEDVSGLLSLQIERGERLGTTRFPIVYDRPAEIARGGTKEYSFIVPLDTTVYPVDVTITDGDHVDHGPVVHTDRFHLRGRTVTGRLAIVLTRRPELDFLLPLYNTRDERGLDLVYPLPERLPDQWYGYDAADLVVLHDGRLHDLTSQQVVAMRDWVASGGRLVVSAGPHFGLSQAGTLMPLGDFTVRDITETTIDTAGFSEIGVPVAENERDAVLVVSPFAEHGSRISRLPVGHGEIVVLPFDYVQLSRLAPLTSVALWNSLLDAATHERRLATEMRRRVFETDLLANQLALPIYRFPSRMVVLGLLGSYVLGLAAILVWAAREPPATRRGLVSAATTAAIAAVIAVVTVAGHIGLTRHMQPVAALALSLERAELPGNGGYAVVTRETALFSRRSAEYRVGYIGSPVILPMTERAHHTRQVEQKLLQYMRVERWGYENTMALQVKPFALSSSVQSGPGFAEVVLANSTDRRIRDVVLLRNGFPEHLGDLDPGSVVEHLSLERTDAEFRSIRWEDFVADDGLRPNRARLVGDIARRQRFEGSAAADLIIVGWTEHPLVPISLEPAFQTTVDLHMVTIPIHLGRGE